MREARPNNSKTSLIFGVADSLNATVNRIKEFKPLCFKIVN